MPSRLMVDSRERAVRHHLEAMGVPFACHELSFGDFEVHQGCEDGVVWSIERKAIDDYAQSIRDGRLKAQRGRAREFAAQHPQVRLAYVIEADRVPSFTSSRRVGGATTNSKPVDASRGVAESAVAGSIFRTTQRDEIAVFWTRNVDDTCAFLQAFLRALDAADAAAGAVPEVPGEQVNLLPLARPATGAKRPRDVTLSGGPVAAALFAQQGMSDLSAMAVAARFPTGRALVDASVEELAAVKIHEKRRLGESLARRIKSVFG